MSTQVIVTAPVATNDPETAHRRRVFVGYALMIATFLALAAYGWDYYTLGTADRPASPKYEYLRPSGHIGLALGYLGLAMFLTIFLYAVRRRWRWLADRGNSRHWLDFHVMMGVTAPFVIAFHSSFKFSGFAGVAFWIMVLVALSGVVGRYVYAQIPRSLNAAEISMGELQELHQRLARSLAQQSQLPAEDLKNVLRLPRPERVAKMPAFVALSYMIGLDVARFFRIARLRRHATPVGERFSTLGGIRRTSHVEIERAIEAAREQSALNKRVLFLSRAHSMFQLWHVIHRPFSYSFAVLAILHIIVVSLLGFVR